MQQSAAKPDEIQLGQVIAISDIRAEAPLYAPYQLPLLVCFCNFG